jgi:hypothetical protein
MASLGGAGESVAVVAVDRTPTALDELPGGIRREVGDTTDQAMAKTLIDRIAGEVGPLRCWHTLSGRKRPRTSSPSS